MHLPYFLINLTRPTLSYIASTQNKEG